MGVYLAAPYRRRAELQGYAADLTECTSSWLYGTSRYSEEALVAEPLRGQGFATKDWKDIRRSTAFVLFTEEQVAEPRRGGMHVELGIALEQRETKLAIVGPRMNVFHTLEEVTQFKSWTDCLEWLRTAAAPAGDLYHGLLS